MKYMQPIVYRPNDPKLKTRFQEHIRYISSNNPPSAFAEHTAKSTRMWPVEQYNDLA